MREEDTAALRQTRRKAVREKQRRRRRLAFSALAAVALLVGGVAVAAFAYLSRDEPPPPETAADDHPHDPRGVQREQSAQLAREAGLTGDYLKASEGHEGFLFPDTFELERGAPASDLVQLQLEDFKRRVAGVSMRYARSKNLTTRDVVTIASMVEEEAQLDSERELIAAVIYNRLREGTPLGIDATVRFATGNFEEPLTESELAVDSPYNTRSNRPAARADIQSGPRVDRSRRASG